MIVGIAGYKDYSFMNKSEALKLLNNQERLARELPEVLALAACEQLGPFHLEGDVLTHTRLVVQNLPVDTSEELIWAAILHDVAKPLTKIEKERNGETITQFIGHEKIGADLAYEITGRLGLNETAREKIRWLIKNHMRIFTLPQMREFKAKEFVNHEYFPDLLTLLKADLTASVARTKEIREHNAEVVAWAEERYRKLAGK